MNNNDLYYYKKKYPLAGNEVSGLEVTNNVPNLSSIGSSIEGEYKILRGIREVEHWALDWKLLDFSRVATELNHIRELTEQIKNNGYIDPLIVGIDKEGEYIIEGYHRFAALNQLGIEKFPAVLVIEEEVLDVDIDKNDLYENLKKPLRKFIKKELIIRSI